MPNSEGEPSAGAHRPRPLPWVLTGCAGAWLMLTLGVYLLDLFWFQPVQRMPAVARCAAQLKQLTTALQMYCQDYNDRLPPADRWADGLLTYTRRTDVLICPSRPGSAPGYAFNANWAQFSLSGIRTPAETPLLFESSLQTPNAAGGLESFLAPHRGSGNVGFADGHVKRYSDVSALRSGDRSAEPMKGTVR